MSRCLDVICPMHVIVEPTGHIRHAGPTLQKMRPMDPLVGRQFFELFELRRPRDARSMADLLASSGVKLRLKFRDSPATSFKGVLVPLPGEDGMLINLSFGISLLEGVKEYALSGADFAATDLAIEMLYLVEAKSAAMAASRQLNEQLQSAKIAAEEQAYTDTLTGLKNRRAMDHILGQLIAAHRPFALMHIDLDYFKEVNDTLGHAAGDFVLQKVAKLMVSATRREDSVARVGGDEFVLIFDGLVRPERLEAVALRIIAELEMPISFGDQLCQVSASGGSVLSEDYTRPDAAQMLADADLALYASKHRGRGCHTFFKPDMRAMQQEGDVGPGPERGVSGVAARQAYEGAGVSKPEAADLSVSKAQSAAHRLSGFRH
ncbi:GGDEF domain-containing protein [Rhodobacteraceae bacterium D3-12]|nr:GGDEF domain-containing protein [Rhodobacteraceae bacterium D3-12]